MRWQTVALSGALSLTIGWALGARFPIATPPAASDSTAPAVPRPLGVAPAVKLPAGESRTADRGVQRTAPRPTRNPFAFGRSAPARRAASDVSKPETEAPEPEPAPEVSRPSLRLAGMARVETPDGPQLTAMVHDGEGLQYVRTGDALPGGYTVVDVQETTVTIRDSSGGERTLRLP